MRIQHAQVLARFCSNPFSPTYPTHTHTRTHTYTHTHTCTQTTGQGRVSLLNVLGELKKCSNHPFLFESAEENYRGDEHDK